MRSTKPLLFLPLAAAVIVLVGAQLFPVDERMARFFHPEIMMVKALAVVGAALAFLRFGNRDLMRWAWFCTGLCYLLLFAMDLFFAAPSRFGQPDLSPTQIQLHTVMAVVANASALVGVALFALVSRAFGMPLPGSATARRIALVASVAVAAIIVGPALRQDVAQLAGGDAHGLAGLASDLSDFGCFCLLVPVLSTAVALRGGALVWPWALLAASQLGWMMYDAVGTVRLLAAFDERALEEMFRALACTFAFVAGVAQVHALRSVSFPARGL
jgi:hypothetical protein